MGTAQGDPDNMFAYAEHTSRREDEVSRYAATVEMSTEGVRRACPDLLPAAEYLIVGDALSAIRAARDVDYPVGRVGQAFLDADQFTPIIGGGGAIVTNDDRLASEMEKAGTEWDQRYRRDTFTITPEAAGGAERAGAAGGMGEGGAATASGDAAERDAANRRRLTAARDELKQQIHEEQLRGADTSAAQHKLDELNGIQAGLDAVNPNFPGVRHYLLSFDTDGPYGHAAISSGDPYSASTRNVTTEVSGLGTDVTGIGADVVHGDAIASTADAKDGANDTAVVTWYGYDAPHLNNNPLAVASADAAKAGAPALVAFQQQLVDLHQGAPANMTVIGHSYGSQVVAYAATLPGGLNAQNVVFIGSPGVPQNSVRTLLGQGVHVFAGEKLGDPVPMFGRPADPGLALLDKLDGRDDGTPLGLDPCLQNGVTVFDTGLMPNDANPLRIHQEGYWQPGPALDNLSAIVSGHYGS